MMKPPIILARQEKRSGDAPTLLPSPGPVSIMQREPSGSHIPNSPPIPSSMFPGHGGGDPLPPSSGPSHPPPPQVLKARDEGKGGRNQRRQDNMSSGPSNYTPLQPGVRGGGRGGEAGGGHSRTSADHSVFLAQTNEMNHPVKLIDRNLHWDDKGADYMLEQSDFLVVGVIGKQGVGKSTVMSLLAGTRTGAPKPFMFRTQSREVVEAGGYQTAGVDVVVTAERAILLDTQPVLSETLLEQISLNESSIPPGLSAEAYLEVMSLKMAIFLYSVCHVVLVVMDSLDSPEILFRFLGTAEQMKSNCLRLASDNSDGGDKKPKEYFPNLVFVLNHASADDYQPFTLKETHLLLADRFQGAKFSINGGISLYKSGIVPVGRGFPMRKASKTSDDIDPVDVNLHLLPTNTSATDTFGVYTASKPDNADTNLNPILKLLASYTGHPSFTLLSETFRNQVFSMPRSPICRNTQQQQQLTEREWFDYARRSWMMLKKSELLVEYERLLQTAPQS